MCVHAVEIPGRCQSGFMYMYRVLSTHARIQYFHM